MKSITILLVEDNDGDILLTSEALSDSRILNELMVLKDGKEAIEFFENMRDMHVVPDLILLDINLPRRNGHEVLEFLKTSEHFKQIPVIMLTTSSSEADIRRSYQHHANCYVTKPFEVTDFVNAITKIEDFWLNLVRLPGIA